MCIFSSVYFSVLLNSLRPSDAIWRQWSWTTLAQVMACCLTAPSHYLNQCWLITRGVLWHTSESSFAGIAQGIDSGYEFEKDILKNIFKSPRGQWVKLSRGQRRSQKAHSYVVTEWCDCSCCCCCSVMIMTQTQTQTKFIQQKQMQVPCQVYMTFIDIQIIIRPWHINDYKHIGRPPEATRKGKACTAVVETAMQLDVN